MGRIIGIWAVTAVAVALTFMLLPGIGFANNAPLLSAGNVLNVDVIVSTVIFSAVLALVNNLIKPICKLIALPITIVTLGIFALVINVAMLYLASWISNSFFDTGLIISGFFSALLASLLIGLLTAVLGALAGVERDSNKSRRKSRSDR